MSQHMGHKKMFVKSIFENRKIQISMEIYLYDSNVLYIAQFSIYLFSDGYCDRSLTALCETLANVHTHTRAFQYIHFDMIS